MGGKERLTREPALSHAHMLEWPRLVNAYHRARRGKRTHPGVTEWFLDWEVRLLRLRDRLDHGWVFGPYRSFVIRDPKERRVAAAPFEDRIVHHALVSLIGPALEKRMLRTVTACRKGLGLGAAHHALLRECRRPSLPYFAKCDVRRYFASVRHDVLLGLLTPYCADDWARGLAQQLVQSWSDAPGRGMPIGNLTSQLFANAYLTRTDLTMTRTVGARSYLRYVDDFVWFGPNAAVLHGQVRALAEELGRVGLCLHPAKTRVAPVSEGVDFAGVIAFPERVRLRARSKRRALALWRKRREQHAQGTVSEGAYQSFLLSLVALGVRTGARGWLRSRGLSW